jgi:hypothetical protein
MQVGTDSGGGAFFSFRAAFFALGPANSTGLALHGRVDASPGVAELAAGDCAGRAAVLTKSVIARNSMITGLEIVHLRRTMQ